MKKPILILLSTLPLAGCFNSDDGESQKLISLDSAIESHYTVNEGSLYSKKIDKMKGELLLAHSEISGVSIDAVTDGWVISFKAPWVANIEGALVQSKPYTVTLRQKINEFDERKKTITFNVMDIASIPKIDFNVKGAQPSSVVANINKKDSSIVQVKSRLEHGFMLPFKVIEEDADDISLGLSISQNGSALSGAKIEQVSSDTFNLIVPIDIRNPLKDVDISLLVSDQDGQKLYTVSHRRIVTPQIEIDIDKPILVREGKVASVNFNKNFAGSDYHFEVSYFEKDMSPIKSQVWIDYKLTSTSDFVEFSVNSVPERWDGIVEIVVIRDGERGVHHYPISVR